MAIRATATVDARSYDGLGVPFNGCCPCTPSGPGHDVTAIGRTPAVRVLGADVHALRYSDGITVVVHFNRAQSVDRAQLRAVADAIHAAATESSEVGTGSVVASGRWLTGAELRGVERRRRTARRGRRRLAPP